MMYEESKSQIKTLLESYLNEKNDDFDEKWKFLKESDPIERAPLVDFGLREILKSSLSFDLNRYENILDLSIKAAEKEFCSSSLPVLLLSDMFDTSTIDICENLFILVEKKVEVWKKDFFFSGCKNHLLRCCNDLLRRLSRSQNTVFCGRILMFLATLFPLSERSGLNIASEFNLDNKTQFSANDSNDLSDDSSDTKINIDSSEDSDINRANVINYNLYRKFWELQEFFREPNQLFSKIPWKKFTTYSNEVMSVFESFKLDHVRSSSWKTEELENSDKPIYFAKYLTSPKLLDLEMSDTNFRRYVLLQFLIMFQYLTSNVKFKSEKKLSLTDDQAYWVSNVENRIYKLLEETPPDGVNFAKCTKNILDREEYWNNWKNEGCPNFEPPADKKPENEGKKLIKKKRPAIGNVLREATVKKRVLMGNAELTRLWNLFPDNMEACCSSRRNFMPSIDNYFEEAIEQLKPEHGIEDQYKLINDTNFGWKSLRLLSRQSHHFFTHGNQPCKSLSSYLENMMKKITKDFPHLSNSEENGIPTKSEVPEMADNDEDMEDDELLKNDEMAKNNNDEDKEEKSSLVTLEHVEVLAQKLGSEWKTIAPKLGFQEDEILFFESEHASVFEQGRKMLLLWTENEGDDATIDSFTKTIDSLNLGHLITDVFTPSDN